MAETALNPHQARIDELTWKAEHGDTAAARELTALEQTIEAGRRDAERQERLRRHQTILDQQQAEAAAAARLQEQRDALAVLMRDRLPLARELDAAVDRLVEAAARVQEHAQAASALEAMISGRATPQS